MADQITRVGLEFTAEGVEDFQSALEGVTKATKENYKELKNAQSHYDKNTSAATKLADKQKYLQQQTEAYQKKVQVLSAQLQEMENDENASESAVAKKRAEVERATKSLGDYQEKLASVSAELGNHDAKLERWGEAIQRSGEIAGKAGKFLTGAVTAPIVAVGTAAAKGASEFETSFAKVATIANETEVPLDSLKRQIIDMSNETGISANSIAESVYSAISAGRSTGEAVEFVGQANKLALAGFTSTENAVDTLTTVMNAYGDSAGSAEEIANRLITTQNLGKTTVDELGASMGKVIPSAAMYGVKLDQLASAYVTTTKNGIATAESGTYINSMLNELGKSGTTAANTLKDKTGKSFSELMAEGKSLTDVLDVISSAAEENGKTMADMFGSQEAAKAAATLTQHAEDFNGAMQSMGSSAGVLQQAFEKVDSTTQRTLAKSLNELKNTSIELGGAILKAAAPAIEQFGQMVGKLSAWFQSLTPAQQEFIVKIGAIAAAVGPLLIVFSVLANKVGGVMTKLGELGGITGMVSKAIGFLSSPVGIAIAAIAALTAAGVLLYKNWDKVKEGAAKLGEGIKNAWGKVKDWTAETFGPIGDKVKEAFGPVGEAISGVWDKVKGAFGQIEIPAPLTTAWDGLVGIATNIWDNIKGVFTGEISVGQLLTNAWDGIKGIASGIWEGIKSVFTGGIQLPDFVTDLWDSFTAKAGEIWQSIKGVFTGEGPTLPALVATGWTAFTSTAGQIWEQIKGVFKGAPELPALVATAWTAFTNTAGQIWASIKSVFTGGPELPAPIATAWTAFISTAGQIWEAIKGAVSGLGPLLPAPLGTLWTGFISTAGQIWESIKGAVSGTGPLLPAPIGTLWTGFVATAGQIWEQIKGAVSGLGPTLPAPLGTLWTGFIATAQGIWERIKGVIDNADPPSLPEIATDAWDGLEGLAETAWKKVTDFFSTVTIKFPDFGKMAEKAFEGIKTAAKSIWDAVTGIFGGKGDKDNPVTEVSGATEEMTQAFADAKLKINEVDTSEITKANEFVKASILAWEGFLENCKLVLPAVQTQSLTVAKAAVASAVNTMKTSMTFTWELPKLTTTALDTAKQAVSTAVSEIKKAMNFSWSLPPLHGSLPVISVSMQTATSSDGKTSVSYPSLSVSGYTNFAQGGILTRPTLFGMVGGNGAVGGEAGAEAVLPLKKLWSEMDKRFGDGSQRPINIYVDGSRSPEQTAQEVARILRRELRMANG